jgi:glycine/D-amino acid oxidase-like deaminating enzyme
MAVLPKALHRLRILVIGGSIAGLACGYALAKAGHDVVIFERSDGLWRVRSQAIPGFECLLTTRLQSPALAHCPPQMIRTLIRWGVDYAKLIQLGTVLDAAGYKLGVFFACAL